MFRQLILVAAGGFAATMSAIAAAQELPTPLQAGIESPDVGAAEEPGVEAQMRGPVHEAFAEPVAIDAQAPAAVTQEKPPEAVEEIPPAARPAEPSAVWIPGYWSWDDVEKRYLWVSGAWRIPPSGQRWVPGYWTEAEGGYQRVNGFWAPVEEQQVEYLPQPPATLEVGPNVAAPSDNYFWVPGCWIYSNQQYRWRPGYWHTASPNWMWVPDRYNWTPRGYVFSSGYWDYADWSHRGVLFAPVYFSRPIYRTAGYYFTPRVLINLGFLGNHFFYRPGFHNYYFGDYYGGSYLNRGFRHLYSWNQWGRGWDPYYNHFRWTNTRSNPRWHDQWRGRYDYYSRSDGNRLPRTWKDARDWERRGREGRPDWDRDRRVAASVDDVIAGRDRSQVRLTRLDENERSRYQARARELRSLSQQRGNQEVRAGSAAGVDRDGRTDREGAVAADRDRTRGSFRLPETEQFRRSAAREPRQRTGEVITRDGRLRDQADRAPQEAVTRPDEAVRRQLERSRVRPEFDGRRTVGRPPTELRREGGVRLRYGTPPADGQPRLGSRDVGRPSPSIERRSFTPSSQGAVRQQPPSSRGRASFEGAPRSAPRFDSRPSGGESRSFRSGGGGPSRSFRSGGGGGSGGRATGGGGGRGGGRSGGGRGGKN